MFQLTTRYKVDVSQDSNVMDLLICIHHSNLRVDNKKRIIIPSLIICPYASSLVLLFDHFSLSCEFVPSSSYSPCSEMYASTSAGIRYLRILLAANLLRRGRVCPLDTHIVAFEKSDLLVSAIERHQCEDTCSDLGTADVILYKLLDDVYGS